MADTDTKREDTRTPLERELDDSRAAAIEAHRNGERVVVLQGEVFRATERPNAWHIIQLARAERRNDNMEALARFGDMLEQCIHPDDNRRMDHYLSMSPMPLDELQTAIADQLLSGKQPQFDEAESLDPTGPSESGRASQ